MTYNHSRPLSPHLQIYKWQLTSVLSILHRFTEIIISVAVMVLPYWLWALGRGGESYMNLIYFCQLPIIKLGLWFVTLAFYYHVANWLRHFAWDWGYGFKLSSVYRSGWAAVIVSLLLTCWTWWG